MRLDNSIGQETGILVRDYSPARQYLSVPPRAGKVYTHNADFSISFIGVPLVYNTGTDNYIFQMRNGAYIHNPSWNYGICVYFNANEICLQFNTQYIYLPYKGKDNLPRIDAVYDSTLNELRWYINSIFLHKFTAILPFELCGPNEIVLGTGWFDVANYYGGTIVCGWQEYNYMIDRKGGVAFSGYLEALRENGNWIPEELHKYVQAHYTLQDTPTGALLVDSTPNYNHAKIVPPLANGNFSSGLWIQGGSGGWTLDSGIATDLAGNNSVMWTPYPLTPNTSYKVTSTINAVTGKNVYVQLTNYPYAEIKGSVHTTPGTYTEILTTKSVVEEHLLFIFTEGTGSASVSNFKIEPVPIAKNPIQMVGYADVAAARIDLLTKVAPAASAIPPITKAISIDGGGMVMNVPKAGVGAAIDGGNFSIYFVGYYAADRDYNDNIFYWYNGYNLIDCRIHRGRAIVYLGNNGGYYSAELPLPLNEKGIISGIISRVGYKNLEIRINGIKLMLEPVNMPFALVGGDYSGQPEIYDLVISDTDTLKFDDIRFSHVMAVGITKGTLSVREAFKLYNFGHIANPESLGKWLRYYQLADVDTNGHVTDLTGNGAKLVTNWDGYYITPGDFNYQIKPLHDLLTL